MSQKNFTLASLAKRLDRDRREIEKLAEQGKIPGRKVGGEWQFHPAEVTQWLEQEMRGYNAGALEHLEDQMHSSEIDNDFPVSRLMTVDTIQVPLQARTKRSVLEKLIEISGYTWQLWEPSTVLQSVQEREEIASTAFENGVAIPHPRTPLPDAIGTPIIAYGRTFSGIPFGAPARQLTDIFFLTLSRDAQTHLQILARLGRLMQLPEFLPKLRSADDARTTYDAICAADELVGRS